MKFELKLLQYVHHIIMFYKHVSFFMLCCLDRASMHLYLWVSFIIAIIFTNCLVGEILKIMGRKGEFRRKWFVNFMSNDQRVLQGLISKCSVLAIEIILF